MNFLFLFLTFLLINFCEGDSRKYYLQQFKPGIKSLIIDIEPGANLYLSTFDDVSYLRNITLTSGGTTVTAEQLSLNKNNDGTQKSLSIAKDGVTIETTNSLNITFNLSGTLYATTANQASDPNFVVFVVTKDSQTINRKDFQNSTIVLLNPNNLQSITNPLNNAYVDEIVQSKTTSFIVFRNFPGSNYQDLTSNSTIFCNPLKFRWNNNATTEIFFSHIEPLQFPTDAIYIILSGGLSFRASSQWIARDKLTTSALTTTGLILNAKVDSYSRVNFMENANVYQTMGTVTNANVDYDLRVNMIMLNSTIYQVFEKGNPVYNQVKYIDSHINSLTVDPQSSAISDYSIQYFSIDGMAFPTESSTTSQPSSTPTTKYPSTTKKVELTTTTSGVAKLSVYITILCVLIHI